MKKQGEKLLFVASLHVKAAVFKLYYNFSAP